MNPTTENPVDLVKFLHKFRDVLDGKEYACHVLRLSYNESNQLSQHDEQLDESNGNEHAE